MRLGNHIGLVLAEWLNPVTACPQFPFLGQLSHHMARAMQLRPVGRGSILLDPFYVKEQYLNRLFRGALV